MKIRIILLILTTLLIVQGKAGAAVSDVSRVMLTHSSEVGQYEALQQDMQFVGQRIRPTGKVFIFDPRQHKWFAYNNGRLIASGRAAGGAGYCKDIGRSCRTPTGTFRILHKGGANCRSTRYPRPNGGARMDYCMFFSKYYAIHGSNHVPAANVSHGCVRVEPSAARWLHGNFLFDGTSR